MLNLKRYIATYQAEGDRGMFEDVDGPYVKFDDIKEFLKPAHNTDILQLLSKCKPFMSLRNGSNEESTKFTSVIGRVRGFMKLFFGSGFSGSCREATPEELSEFLVGTGITLEIYANARDWQELRKVMEAYAAYKEACNAAYVVACDAVYVARDAAHVAACDAAYVVARDAAFIARDAAHAAYVAACDAACE